MGEDSTYIVGETDVRQQAIGRLKAKKAFWRLAGGSLLGFVLLTVIWALSGGGYFWPAWALFGFLIALATSGWAAFGPRQGITEAQIEAETKKIQGS